MDGDEFDFDFPGEPETVETAVQGSWPGRLRALRNRGGDNGRGRRPSPPGLAGIGRLAGVVTVTIASVVALVTGLGACQGARDNYAAYLSEVRTLAQSSDRAGGELASVLRSSSKSADLTTKLQDLAALEQQAYDQAQQVRPPGPLRQVHRELLAALELRATGLAGLEQALASAGSARTATPSAADALTAQARLLTTSDVVWDQLYRIPAGQQLRDRRITNLVVPQSQFVSKPELVSAAAFTLLLQRLNGAPIQNQAALLKPGATGAAVKAWQKQLNRWLPTHGQPLLPIDGSFGALTVAATKSLQQAAGITADGIVGPTTRQALTHQLAGTSSHSQG